MKTTRKQLINIIKTNLINEIPGLDFSDAGGDPPAEYQDKNLPDRATTQTKYYKKQILFPLFLPISEIIMGFTPAGIAIDVKDLAIAIKAMSQNPGSEEGTNLAIAAFGFVPGVGDATKSAYRSLKVGLKNAQKGVKASGKVYSNGNKINSSYSGDVAAENLAKKLKRKHPGHFKA